MDEYKKFKADVHNVLSVGYKYYIRNRGSNKRNKKMALLRRVLYDTMYADRGTVL